MLQEPNIKIATRNQGPNKQSCYVWYKMGHLARNCYFKHKQKNQNANQKKLVQNIVLDVKKTGHVIQTCWFKKGKLKSTLRKTLKKKLTQKFL